MRYFLLDLFLLSLIIFVAYSYLVHFILEILSNNLVLKTLLFFVLAFKFFLLFRAQQFGFLLKSLEFLPLIFFIISCQFCSRGSFFYQYTAFIAIFNLIKVVFLNNIFINLIIHPFIELLTFFFRVCGQRVFFYSLF